MLEPAPQTIRRARAAPGSGSRLRVVLQTGAGLGLLGLWLHSVPIAQVWQNARPHHLWPLSLIVVCTVSSALLRAGRWKLLLTPVHRVPALDMFWINSAGNLVNYLIPLRAGDAVRYWWIQRRHPVPRGACLSSLMVDKVMDLGAMLGFLAPAGLFVLVLHGSGAPLDHVLWLTAAGPALTLAGLLAAIILGPSLAAWPPVASRLRPSWIKVIRDESGWFRLIAKQALVGRRLGRMAAMSVAALAFDGLAFSLLFYSLDIHLSYAAALAGSIGITVSYGLPAAPGYVGNVEVAGSMVLATGLGVQRAVAAGAVLLWHALAAATVVALGLVALSRLRSVTAGQAALARPDGLG